MGSARTTVSVLALGLCLLAATPSADGTTWIHDPATPGDWFDPANWSAGVPTSSDRARINNGGQAQIAAPNAQVYHLHLGLDSTESGTLVLSGTGQLSAHYEHIGWEGTGTFTQTGGTHTVSSSLYLGFEPGSDGTYDISGGSLNVKNLYVGLKGRGTLKITDSAADITISNLLRFGPDGTFTAVPGATIHMTGAAFENRSTDPTDLAGLSNLNLIFEGGSGDVDPFEVAGEDRGPVLDGFEDNFALGSLTLGASAGIGQVLLVDNVDNQPGDETLYVHNLVVGPGSSLDLNGLNLYYLSASIDPDAIIELNGGQLLQVPEPATLILLGGGLLALLRRRRTR